MLTIILSAIVAAAGSGPAPATPSPQVQGEVFFRFDSSELPRDARDHLQAAVARALTNSASRIVLDAHCDPIGTAPYNIGLAIRRAQSVRAALIEMGVPSEQIVLAFYGEDGARRATYAEDRRVSVWLSRTSIDDVTALTFERGGTGLTWGRPLTVAQLAAAPEPIASREI